MKFKILTATTALGIQGEVERFKDFLSASVKDIRITASASEWVAVIVYEVRRV